jgi:hypothetical protein
MAAVGAMGNGYGAVRKERAGKLANWQTGKLANWQAGRLVSWRVGKLTSRRVGCVWEVYSRNDVEWR